MMSSSSNHASISGLTFALCYFVLFLEVFELVLLTSGIPLHLVIEPQSAFLRQGSMSTLDCVPEPRNADVRWYFNGSLMTSDEQEIIGDNGRRLNLISNVKTGIFHCVANNSDGAVRSLPAFVSNAYLNDFSAGLADRTIEVIVKNTAVIPCATPAGQPPTITEFEINSTKLITTARHLILPSGNLQISNVRTEDAGLYRCVAVNPLTGDRRSAPVIVNLKVKDFVQLSQPQFTWTPHSHMEVVRGQNLTLECVAEGWPVPPLSWKRYGGFLPEGRSKAVWGNLMINRVQKSDEGTYICRAEVNSTHSRDYVTFVDVLEPPVVTLSSSDQNVTQFDSVTLMCNVTGSPKISIQWLHNALPVVTSRQVIVSPNGSLTLRSVQLRHSGIYQCFGENSVGVAYASTRLTIGVGEIDFDSVLHDAMHNFDANSDKVSSGPRMRGTRKLKKLQKNLSDRPGQTSTPDSDTGDLSKDDADEEAIGTIATLLPPSKPTVTKTSDNSVLLNWTESVRNGSIPVVFFKIQFKEIVNSKKSRWKTLDEEIPPSSHSYEVLFLKSDASYQFRIAAVYLNNDNKIGPVSDAVALKTGLPSSGRSRAPVSSPMIVDVHENVTSFIIFWQYQPTERVAIDGFKIFYKPYDDDVDYRSIRVMGSSRREATVTELKPDTSYSMHMLCFNGDGESNSSLSVTTKTLGLFGSSVTPLYEKEFIEPADKEQSKTTTLAVRAYYATNRVNTHASNELLFIVLGVVLGIMMLVLCIVMVMCACKQRQQQRLMAALDGRRKFHDPSKALFVGSQIKSTAEGNFLLNGVGTAPKKANGYSSVRGNGVAQGAKQLASEYELNSTVEEEKTRMEEVPLKICPNSSECDECDEAGGRRVLPLSDERQTDHDPTSKRISLGNVPESSVRSAAAIYHPPDDLPMTSRSRDLPFQQPSLKSRSSCDNRLPVNDSEESYPSIQATASPDHIPRLHECQLLYRSPEHPRRSRDKTRGRREQASDRSLSTSSQASGGNIMSGKHPNPGGHSEIVNILPAGLRSFVDENHPDDESNVVDGFGGSAVDIDVPIASRISQGSPSRSRSDGRKDSDCSETDKCHPTSWNETRVDS